MAILDIGNGEYRDIDTMEQMYAAIADKMSHEFAAAVREIVENLEDGLAFYEGDASLEEKIMDILDDANETNPDGSVDPNIAVLKSNIRAVFYDRL